MQLHIGLPASSMINCSHHRHGVLGQASVAESPSRSRLCEGNTVVPFSTTFEDHPVIKGVLRVRRNPTAAYGIALFAVALATLVRSLVGGQVVEGVPFITYYPAIIVATLAAGFWPGILALALSSATAMYFFMPPLFGPDFNQREVVSLLLFIFMASINVVIVAVLDLAIERIMAQVQNVRALIESAPNGLLVVDRQGIIRLINPAAEKLFGYAHGELVGRPVDDLVPHQRLEAHRAGRIAYHQNPEVRTFRDLSGRHKDGRQLPVDVGLNPVSSNGEAVVLATVIDISDRTKAQEVQKLIIRELHHRTQNLFAVFLAIATRTVDENKTNAEIKFVLNGRIQALAHAYALIAESAWAAILERELAGFTTHLNVAGCDIVVSPSATQQFALIVHELATNALKYGALSIPDGHVAIDGKIERLDGGGTFSFVWKETGGPRVTTPTRKGFGSVILLDSAKQFCQSVTLDYPPHGLRYELQVQLSAIEASMPSPTSSPESSPTS